MRLRKIKIDSRKYRDHLDDIIDYVWQQQWNQLFLERQIAWWDLKHNQWHPCFAVEEL